MRVSFNVVGLVLLSGLPFSLQSPKIETSPDAIIDSIDDESIQNFSFSNYQADADGQIIQVQHRYPAKVLESFCLFGNTETCSGIRHPRWRAMSGRSVYEAQFYVFFEDDEDEKKTTS